MGQSPRLTGGEWGKVTLLGPLEITVKSYSTRQLRGKSLDVLYCSRHDMKQTETVPQREFDRQTISSLYTRMHVNYSD